MSLINKKVSASIFPTCDDFSNMKVFSDVKVGDYIWDYNKGNPMKYIVERIDADETSHGTIMTSFEIVCDTPQGTITSVVFVDDFEMVKSYVIDNGSIYTVLALDYEDNLELFNEFLK